MQVDRRVHAGFARGLDAGFDLLDRHGHRAGGVGRHGLPLLAVGVDEVAVGEVVAVLRGHAHVELAEVLQVEVVAAAAGAVRRGAGEEIEIVDADLARPCDGREVLPVAEPVECLPCVGRVALVQEQIRFEDVRLAGLEPHAPADPPCFGRVALQGLEEDRLHRRREQRDVAGAAVCEDVHNRRQQRRAGCRLTWIARLWFEIVA